MPDNSSIPTPIPEFEPGPWSPAKAGKMILWAIGYWKVAVAAGVHMAPAATEVVERLSTMTGTVGITLHINAPVFESMLPVIIFAGVLTGHDFARFKLIDNPLAKKIL